MKKIKNIYVLLQVIPSIIVEYVNTAISETEVSEDLQIEFNELAAYLNTLQIQDPALYLYFSKSTYLQNGKAIPCIKLYGSATPPPDADFDIEYSFQPQGELERLFDGSEVLTAGVNCEVTSPFNVHVSALPAFATFELPWTGVPNAYESFNFNYTGGILTWLGYNGSSYVMYHLILEGTGLAVQVIGQGRMEIVNLDNTTYTFLTNDTITGVQGVVTQPGAAGPTVIANNADVLHFYFTPALPVNTDLSFYDVNDVLISTVVAGASDIELITPKPAGSSKVVIAPSAP